MQNKIKDILLIGPYNPEGIRTGQYLSPPLGIYRIASHLEKKALANVDVVDPTLNYEETLDKIKGKKYDIIGHSILHPTLKEDLKLIWKTHNLSPSSLQIVGGQGGTFNAEEILTKTPVSAVSRGFGEKILEQIVEGGGEFNHVRGLYLLDGEKMVSTGNINKMDMDEFKNITLNLDFDKIPYSKYWKFMESQYNKQHVHAMKNEGMIKTIRLMISNYCPLGCTHCTSTNFLNEAIDGNQRVLFLEPEEIVHMMKKAVKNNPDAEAFYFNDDNFLLLRKKRILEFCDLTRKLDKKYNLMFQGRVDDVDKETLVEMGKAGFKIGFYGAETFSDRLARDIRKMKTGGQDYGELAKKVLHDTMDAGLVAQFSLMLFLPSSKKEDLEKTIESTLDLMEEGARATIFPYVEAYAGAKIVNNHELSYNEFEIENRHFRIPSLVLPDDKDIRAIAENSLKLKGELNKERRWEKFKGKVPQPVDTLNLFNAIYKLSGKPTKRIEQMLKKY